MYRALKDKYEGSELLHLAIGPWRHSGANHYGYELGALTFNGDTSAQWRTQWMKPFLDHYLKGCTRPAHAAGADLCERGNRWEESPRWPMGTPTPLYLTAGNSAGFDRPATAGHDDYVSDPAKPVPFLPRP